MRGRAHYPPGTPRSSRSDWWGVVLESPSPREHARFYSALLDWEIASEDSDESVIAPGGSVTYISFQSAEEYVRPVWPAQDGKQRITMHLDFEVEHLEVAVEHARSLGATVPDFQPQDHVRVLLDPAGHPFCLYTDQ